MYINANESFQICDAVILGVDMEERCCCANPTILGCLAANWQMQLTTRIATLKKYSQEKCDKASPPIQIQAEYYYGA